MQAEQQSRLRQRDAGDTEHEHLLQFAARFADDNQRNHHNQARNGGRQIDFPVLDFHQPQIFQRKRQCGKQGHLCGVEGENTEIQSQKLAVFQHFAHTRRLGLCVFMEFRHFRIGRHPCHHGDTGNGQCAGQHKQAGHADKIGNHRRQHQTDGKSQADAQTYHGHRTGTHFVAGQIRQKRRYRRTDCTRTLHRPRRHQHMQRIGGGGKKTACGKNYQTDADDFFAAELIGCDAQRQLQRSLRQSVDAHRHADQRFVVFRAGQRRRIQRQYGQHQKHAEHTQRVHARQRYARPPFGRKHLSVVLSCHNYFQTAFRKSRNTWTCCRTSPSAGIYPHQAV